LNSLFEDSQVTGLLLKDGSRFKIVRGTYKEFQFKEYGSEVYTAELADSVIAIDGEWVPEMICGPTAHIITLFYRPHP
jgi:hypothetical protein